MPLFSCLDSLISPTLINILTYFPNRIWLPRHSRSLLALAPARYGLYLPSLAPFKAGLADEKEQGASIARKFAKSYSVVVLARNPDNYNPVVQEINSSGGQAIGISTDVSDSKSVNAAFDKIQAEYPSSKVAAAVFNPGGGFVVKPFLELKEEDYSNALKSQAYVLAVSCTHLIHFIPSLI